MSPVCDHRTTSLMLHRGLWCLSLWVCSACPQTRYQGVMRVPGRKEHLCLFGCAPSPLLAPDCSHWLWGFLLLTHKSRFPFLYTKHGVHTDIKRTGNDTARGCLHWVYSSSPKGERQDLGCGCHYEEILSWPASRGCSPNTGTQPPAGHGAAPGAFFACTSTGMSRARRGDGWWWGALCLPDRRSAFVQHEAPISAMPDTSVCTPGGTSGRSVFLIQAGF